MPRRCGSSRSSHEEETNRILHSLKKCQSNTHTTHQQQGHIISYTNCPRSKPHHHQRHHPVPQINATPPPKVRRVNILVPRLNTKKKESKKRPQTPYPDVSPPTPCLPANLPSYSSSLPAGKPAACLLATLSANPTTNGKQTPSTLQPQPAKQNAKRAQRRSLQMTRNSRRAEAVHPQDPPLQTVPPTVPSFQCHPPKCRLFQGPRSRFPLLDHRI